MLRHNNADDDVTESSIFDLDHAPAPRSTSLSNAQQLLPVHNARQLLSDSRITPLPIPSSTTSYRNATSLSPRPMNSNRVRNSIVVVPGGDHPAVRSLPPTATAAAGMNRRRLASYSSSSSIPIVGGSNTYGSTTNTGSSTLSHDDDMSIRNVGTDGTTFTTNQNPRQRAYSATSAAFPIEPPLHLTHAQSFSLSRTTTRSVHITDSTRPTQQDAVYVPDRYPPPSVGNSNPIVPIDETKESVDDESNDPVKFRHSWKDESGTITVEDIPYGSDIIQSDTEFSVTESDTPHFHTPITTANDRDVSLSVLADDGEHHPDHPTTTATIHDSTVLSPIHASVTTIKPILFCGCIPLPLCFSKRRISWDRTFVFSMLSIWAIKNTHIF
jgi:hypothetical protein